ncbi:MAG: hypothetical protein ACK40T_02810 [Akkermansiaceae bacterium]
MTDVTEPTVEVTTEIKPEEVKVKETKAEEKPTTEIDRVARIEKHQREQRQKLEAEKLRLEADRAELQEFKRLKQLKNDNPLEVLKSLGLSIDDIVKAANNPKNTDPVAAKALEEVEKIKAELQAEKDKIYRERIAQAEQELTYNIQEAIKAGEYDLIDQLGLTNTVREYMEQVFSETGEVIDPKDAAKEVNNRIAKSIKKVMKSKWLKEEEKAEAIAEIVQNATDEVKAEETSTLSNKMQSESPKTKKPMTEKERLAAAIALLK